jgi:hypothetical protein
MNEALSDRARTAGAHDTPRRLSVVTYHFPRIQSAGVYRMVGFVKYLQRRGWHVTVLTVEDSAHEGRDAQSLALIPAGVDVIRTRSREPAAHLARAAQRGSTQSNERGEAPPASPRKPVVRRILARPGRAAVKALSYPDAQIGWAPRVARDVRAFVRAHPGAVVLSSTPPHSTHLGVRLARAFVRFPWVADFRDPWTAPSRQPKGGANMALQRALERWVLRGADAVIANTRGNRDALLAAFPSVDAVRIDVVPNAFDTETEPAPAGDRRLPCDIAYFGEVYPGMLDAYFAAVATLVARDRARAPRLFVFGLVSEPDVERVRRAGLGEHIVFQGVVSYAKSLELMREAPSLLLLLPDGDAMASCVPSKLYPYLFTNRPILALVPEGDAARVVRETGAGEVVAPTGSDATAERIADFVARVRRGEMTAATRARADAFAMDRAAARVDEILEAVRHRG